MADIQREAGSEPFDWSAALVVVDGDRELLREVVDAFLQECPQVMRMMADAIDAGDAATLLRAAHIMTSAMRTFGVAEAADAAQQLEEMGHREHFADASDYFAVLEGHVDAIVPAAKQLLSEKGEP